MAKVGEAYTPEQINMPQLGTLEYFEWLRQVNAEEYAGTDARTFLEQTQVAESFVKFIRHHPSLIPLKRHFQSSIDSRLMGLGPDWKSIFRGSVETNPALPNNGLLILHGQPLPDELPDNNYSYDAVIPITAHNYYAAHYDANRPLYAAYNWREHEEIIRRRSEVFNEISASEYDRNDPAVLITAVLEAANDLYDAFHYQCGKYEAMADTSAISRERAKWHPNYLADDPDEFNPNHKVLK